jgi:DNA-binding MarR family transcriptional regulator
VSSEGLKFGRDKVIRETPEPAPKRPSLSTQDLAGLAERITAARRRRSDFLSADLFAEPGWDIMLALYQANCAGHRMTSTNLCIASNAPSTTALRWLDNLTELGLVSRRKNPLDARIVFFELAPHARTAIEAYLCDLWVMTYGPAMTTLGQGR